MAKVNTKNSAYGAARLAKKGNRRGYEMGLSASVNAACTRYLRRKGLLDESMVRSGAKVAD